MTYYLIIISVIISLEFHGSIISRPPFPHNYQYLIVFTFLYIHLKPLNPKAKQCMSLSLSFFLEAFQPLSPNLLTLKFQF